MVVPDILSQVEAHHLTADASENVIEPESRSPLLDKLNGLRQTAISSSPELQSILAENDQHLQPEVLWTAGIAAVVAMLTGSNHGLIEATIAGLVAGNVVDIGRQAMLAMKFEHTMSEHLKKEMTQEVDNLRALVLAGLTPKARERFVQGKPLVTWYQKMNRTGSLDKRKLV